MLEQMTPTGTSPEAIASGLGAVPVDLTGGATSAVTRTIIAHLAESALSVKSFGALGDGAQTLVADSYTTDQTSAPTTLTQQTVDGAGINKAIRAARAKYQAGAGIPTIFLPGGTYRVRGYLERIDFPCNIMGAGEGVTFLRAIDLCPNANGYGILCIDQGATRGRVTISHLTVDGNCDGDTGHRANPGGEFRTYNIAFYGSGDFSLAHVRSINAPIDTLKVNYTNESTSSLSAYNCIFDSAYRNSVSCASGWNQHFVNCRFLNGGVPFSGTAPKLCLDVEPNASNATIKALLFQRCHFEGGLAGLVSATWCDETVFDACTFAPLLVTTGSVGQIAVSLLAGRTKFEKCKFRPTANYNNYVRHQIIQTGDFANRGLCEIINCNAEGWGLELQGQIDRLINNHFENSLKSIIIYSPLCEMIGGLYENIGWGDANSGRTSSICTGATSQTSKKLDMKSVLIRHNPNSRPGAWTLPTTQFGLWIDAGVNRTLKGNRIEGYYYIATSFSQSIDNVHWRDFGLPNIAALADTAGQAGATNYYRDNVEGTSTWVPETVVI